MASEYSPPNQQLGDMALSHKQNSTPTECRLDNAWDFMLKNIWERREENAWTTGAVRIPHVSILSNEVALPVESSKFLPNLKKCKASSNPRSMPESPISYPPSRSLSFSAAARIETGTKKTGQQAHATELHHEEWRNTTIFSKRMLSIVVSLQKTFRYTTLNCVLITSSSHILTLKRTSTSIDTSSLDFPRVQVL